jgi:hypothetical protein
MPETRDGNVLALSTTNSKSDSNSTGTPNYIQRAIALKNEPLDSILHDEQFESDDNLVKFSPMKKQRKCHNTLTSSHPDGNSDQVWSVC